MEHFFAEVETRAYRMALIATGNRDDALDIVQDAMCKMVQRYQQRPAVEWGPLFQVVLQRRITDWYRRRKVRSIVSSWFGGEDDDGATPAGFIDYGQPGPASEAGQHQLLATLEEVIHALPLRQQQAFLLRTLEGYDVEETANIMGCSGGSVKTHLSRALKAVREKLGDHWR